MNISQILAMPVGERLGGGFELTIKTAKKKWPVSEGVRDNWFHQVVLMDKTGEILADVNIGKNIPLQRGSTIKIIVARVQAGELANKPIKKLYVDQFSRVTQIGEPEGFYNPSAVELEIRGKIRHGIVCSLIRAGFNLHDQLPQKEIESLVDYIIKGA